MPGGARENSAELEPNGPGITDHRRWQRAAPMSASPGLGGRAVQHPTKSGDLHRKYPLTSCSQDAVPRVRLGSLERGQASPLGGLTSALTDGRIWWPLPSSPAQPLGREHTSQILCPWEQISLRYLCPQGRAHLGRALVCPACPWLRFHIPLNHSSASQPVILSVHSWLLSTAFLCCCVFILKCLTW